MPQTTSMTIHLPVDTNERLEALAYVCVKIKSIKEAIEEADSPHAEFLEHAEVVQRMKKLECR